MPNKIFSTPEIDIKKIFSIDPRALRVFRISLGVVILIDIILRSRNLKALYTNDGVFPVDTALKVTEIPIYTFHIQFPTITGQRILFAITGLLAILFILGYRPNLTAAGLWILIISLRLRNQFITNAGDNALLVLIMWSIFLPFAKETQLFSSDKTDNILTVSTVGILLHICSIYILNLVFKLTTNLWIDGNGLSYALYRGQFTLPPGVILSNMPTVQSFLTYVWLTLLLVSPLLLSTNDRIRASLTTIFIGGHSFMLLSIFIGIFPLVSIVWLVLFYPTSAWDWISRKLRKIHQHSNVSEKNPLIKTFHKITGPFPYQRKDNQNLDTRLPVTNTLHTLTQQIIPLLLIIILIISTINSIGVIDLQKSTEEKINTANLGQGWSLFTGKTAHTEFWIVTKGETKNGDIVKPFDQSGPMNFTRPNKLHNTYETARWREYIQSIFKYNTYNKTTNSFGNYVCRSWNKNHKTNLKNVSIYAMNKPFNVSTPPSSNNPISKELIKNHSCK